MKQQTFNLNEFIKNDESAAAEEASAEETGASVPETAVEEAEGESEVSELSVQKAVVEELAVEKAELHEKMAGQEADMLSLKAKYDNVLHELDVKKAEVESLKVKVNALESKLAAQMAKDIDLQERNPNALALIDRDVDIPDRFPGETRDHVLEVVKSARDKAEADGRVRCAQVLEGVLLANEPNGNLAKRRAALEKLFADNGNLITGPVLEELTRLGISHKNGEEYLLPAEILKRTY